MIKHSLVFFWLCFGLLMSASAFAEITPVGFWKTIDDKTGQPKAIVQIWETPNHSLSGRIVKIFGSIDKQHALCTACTDANQNKPILGMIILEGLEQNKDQQKWEQGSILDPKNGKRYRCHLTLQNQGQQLTLRGYIGFSVLGRSQTWLRTTAPNND